MTFLEHVFITVLDKGILAISVLAAGVFLNKNLEAFRADQDRIAEPRRKNTVR